MQLAYTQWHVRNCDTSAASCVDRHTNSHVMSIGICTELIAQSPYIWHCVGRSSQRQLHPGQTLLAYSWVVSWHLR